MNAKHKSWLGKTLIVGGVAVPVYIVGGAIVAVGSAIALGVGLWLHGKKKA